MMVVALDPRDLSSDPSPERLAGCLQPGDQVWYWNGRVSTDFALPRTTWWPDSPGPLEFHHPGEAGHGREMYNFVIRGDRVMCGPPHMNNPFGSFAWLNDSLMSHPENPSLLYELACLDSIRGQREDALTHLSQAITIKPEIRDWAREDKDFEALRDDPDFVAMTARG